jgi:D-serine deaminase-like pyridoxal phosphate-dependent protein
MEYKVNEQELLRKWFGKAVEELPTPVIVADANAINSNLTLMAEYFEDLPCKLRPHFKSHKCVTLARQQITYNNTNGITCAKVSEAEQLVSGGIQDILIANQVIGIDKNRRLALLNQKATVKVTVDSYEGIKQLGIVAKEVGVNLGVLVEVDIGMNRGGVQPGKPIKDLVEIVIRTPGLRFEGLQGYEGHLVTLKNYQERKQRVMVAMEPLLETKQVLEQEGLAACISAGGTGTYDITGKIDGIDELQCGSYALMDSFYKTIRPEFKNARYILTTVISARGGTISCDVGLKGMGSEYAMPDIVGHPEAKVLYVAEEHTVIQNIGINIGEKLRLIPPHGCTTNNLYDRMWVTRNDIIEDVWPIEGRGCLE